MLRGADISNWQGGKVRPATVDLDFYICKATEGITYVDPCCDPVVQECIEHDKLWGFYHFARGNDAITEAEFFHKHCANYFGHGIPVLDWEDGQSIKWVNEFVRAIHDMTCVWPWIYGNPWRFGQGDVEPNCGRWAAHYFSDNIRTFAQAEAHERPKVDGLMCAWQFTSSGRLNGYSGNLDLDLFFGNEDAWHRYAAGDSAGDSGIGDDSSLGVSTLENESYKVTIERKK